MISQISVLPSAPSIFCKSSKNVKEFTKNEEKTLFNFNVEAITQGHFQNPILQISVHHYSLYNICTQYSNVLEEHKINLPSKHVKSLAGS